MAAGQFLYQCVEKTVTYDLPVEVRYLDTYGTFSERVKTVVAMPDRLVALLRDFLARNGGRLLRAEPRQRSSLT